MDTATHQPTLAQLTERLLAREPAETLVSEVEPFHQSLPHQWIDPAVLWPDALAAALHLLPSDEAASFAKLTMPAGWPRRLSDPENVKLVPLVLGQVPAQLRDATPLLEKGPKALTEMGKPTPLAAAAADGTSLAGVSLSQRLLDAAQDRLDRRFADAAAKLAGLVEEAPESWRSLLENESAALLWAQGRYAEAEALWTESAASFTPVFQFNRALAALRRGDTKAAEPLLRNAAKAFASSTGWHHLAQLYLTLIAL